MNYQVPKFIEVEDKIFGQLTLKQFLYIAGGAGLSFVIYRFSPFFIISAALIILVMGFSLALAFYKVNEKPFIFTVESAFKYLVGKKLYLWKKQAPEVKKPLTENTDLEKKNIQVTVPKLSESKLKDLAWSLDVQESIYSGYTKENRNKK